MPPLRSCRAPDLAVIGTLPATVPGIIADVGKRGTKAAIVMSTGLAQTKDLYGRNMKDLMLKAAKPHLLRILGPNSVGLLVPRLGLNASFAYTNALPGKVAFVSQSGAMAAGVLDWAKARSIGFSKFIFLGDKADVDFGDVLDYLAGDGDTHAILLYLEAIRDTRMFVQMRELSPGQLARMTQIDYDREKAFIAMRKRPDGTSETLGVARIVFDSDSIQGEFAVTVRSDLKDKGLGKWLMQKLIRHARDRGAQEIVGETLSQNQALLGLVKPFGFSAHRSRENDTFRLKLALKES